MKTKNSTILMFILVFTGITLCYSQGWTENSLALSFFPKKMTYTCPNQGPAAAKTVVVKVKYNEKNEMEPISAAYKNDPKITLGFREVDQTYLRIRGNGKVRVGIYKNSVQTSGSIGCTKKNLPVLFEGNGEKVWFIYETNVNIKK